MKFGRKFILRLVCTAIFSFAVLPALALDPAKPPAGNFDLTHWKLTLPVDTNGGTTGTAAEVQIAQILTGYTNAAFFFTGGDGAMVFRTPIPGATTSGSTYPRSELREMLNPTDTGVNWTGHGTHILNAQCKVTQIPSSGKVIIGQIHGYLPNDNPLIKLQFYNGTIQALVKEDGTNDTKFTYANVGLSNRITYQIAVTNGLLAVTVNGSNQAVNIFQTHPEWTSNTFYFKAGNYCQDNTNETATAEVAQVMFYQLSVRHGTPPVFTNLNFNPAGRFSATLVGEAGSNYVVQTSTNLASWTPLVTNNSPTGVVNFTDSNAVSSRRFYRATVP